MRTLPVVIAAFAAGVVLAPRLAGPAATGPDIAGPYGKLMAAVNELERSEAYIISDDGAFLGRISRKKDDEKSIACPYGDFGLGNTNRSMFAASGIYGSTNSDLSAFTIFAKHPPHIEMKIDGKVETVGYLTTNVGFEAAAQRINPRVLLLWLSQ